MFAYLYILISVLVFFFSYRIFLRVSGSMSLTKLNMISWIFYFDLILQIFIASMLVVLDIDNHYMISKMYNNDSRVFGWIFIQYSMITLPLGMLFSLFLWGYKKNNVLFDVYIKSELMSLSATHDKYIRYSLYFLTTLSVSSVIYVLYSLDSILILDVLNNTGKDNLSSERYMAGTGFTGNTYVKNIFAIGFTPLLCFIAYAYFIMTRRRFDLVWFLLLLLASFFILTYNLEKAPIIKFMLGFLFFRVLVFGRIPLKKVIVFFFTSSCCPCIFLLFDLWRSNNLVRFKL